MLTAEEIKKSIIQLPEKEYRKLRKWFSERDWEEWDKTIAQDAQAGWVFLPKKRRVRSKAACISHEANLLP